MPEPLASPVTEVPPAHPSDAESHFAAKLAFETDCWVAADIERKTGLHGTLAGDATRCGHCHSEHHGAEFDIAGARAFALAGVPDAERFDHAGLAFTLSGKHLALGCERCHADARTQPLPRDHHRFLGLEQRCASCHEDVHHGALPDCAACHGEEQPFAAVAAFDCHEELRGNVERYAANRRVLLDGLPGTGLTDLAPADGAFYVWARSDALAEDSQELCTRWLNELGVAATPGIDFDPARGRSYVRFSFAGATADMREAVRRLQAFRP